MRRLLILAAILLTSCEYAETPPSIIRFGGVGSGFGKPYGTGIFGIAQARHSIEDELNNDNTKIEWIYFTGTGPAINEALATGQLDFAQYGSLPSIIARASGLPTQFIMSGGFTNIYGMTLAGTPIKTLADLKGRRVTLQKATILHWSLLSALHQAGLTDRDVTILDLKTADQVPAMSAGSADAVFGVTNLLPLRDDGRLTQFYSTATGSLAAAGPSGMFVTDVFAKAYPETTERIVRGMVKAAYWLAQPQNRAEAVAIWAKIGVPAKSIAEDVADRPLRDQLNPLLNGFVRAQYKDGEAFAREERLIRKDFDVDAWINNAFLDQALRETSLTDFWPVRTDEDAKQP